VARADFFSVFAAWSQTLSRRHSHADFLTITSMASGSSPVKITVVRWERDCQRSFARFYVSWPRYGPPECSPLAPLVYTNQFDLWRLTLPGWSRSVKILVCMKQVPQKDAPLKLNEAGTWIREDVSYEVNEPDAFALEEALRQKEKHTGEVIVITAGPARAMQVLREALAKGADRAIHLEDDAFVGLDAYNTARAIADAIKDEKFDLIFTGLQSDDYGYAQTGVILAQILGWPHATIIMQIEKTDAGIRVKRELEAGFFQFVDMPLPAVLTIQSGINKLRYATLIGIKQAKNKPLRKVTLAEVQSAVGGNLQKIEKLYVPQKSKNTEFLEGPPAEVAKKLVEKLKNELRVI
jgi:electron transfer flavoprotein beta subunit